MDALRVFEKHPALDAYKFGPSFTPYAIVAVDKRFTDAELAAEWQYQDNRVNQVCDGYSVCHDGTDMGTEAEEIARLATIHRFASLPDYDAV